MRLERSDPRPAAGDCAVMTENPNHCRSDENTSDVALRLTDVPDKPARERIRDSLERFNDEVTGIPDEHALDVLLTDSATGEVLGGLVGRTSLGVLFVSFFFLPDTLRRRGLGSRMLRQAEEEARRRGCRRAVLFTISFQAPGFYERHGYRVFGRIACEPPGHARLFMTKELT
jgi:GNAT superfamily N-acetyltransferase